MVVVGCSAVLDQHQITLLILPQPTTHHTTTSHTRYRKDTPNTLDIGVEQVSMALLERNLGSSGRRLLQLVQDHAAREPVRATLKGLVHHGRHSRSKFVANNLRDQVPSAAFSFAFFSPSSLSLSSVGDHRCHPFSPSAGAFFHRAKGSAFPVLADFHYDVLLCLPSNKYSVDAIPI